MAKSKFSFFQVQVKRVSDYAIELGQTTLCIAPEKLMPLICHCPFANSFSPWCTQKCLSKLISTKPSSPTPAIGVDHCVGLYMAPNNALQCGFGAVRHNFDIDLALSFQKAKHDSFAISSPSTFATNPVRTEVRFIDFYRTLKRRLQFIELCNPSPNLQEDTVHRAHRNTDLFNGADSRKIERKIPDKLPEFGLADFRTVIVPIFINHIRKLTYLNRCFAS